MTTEHYQRVINGNDRIYKSACSFIIGLRRAGVPLSVIERNDWASSTPRVYIDLRGYKGHGYNERNIRGYERHDAHSLKQAIRYFKTA